MVLLATTTPDPAWEAEKAGWRCFVMSNANCAYRPGSDLHAAWQRGFAAAGRSPDAERLML